MPERRLHQLVKKNLYDGLDKASDEFARDPENFDNFIKFINEIVSHMESARWFGTALETTSEDFKACLQKQPYLTDVSVNHVRRRGIHLFSGTTEKLQIIVDFADGTSMRLSKLNEPGRENKYRTKYQNRINEIRKLPLVERPNTP